MKITSIFLISLMIIHILYPCQSCSDRLHFENEEISINVISKISMVHVNTSSYASHSPIFITDNDGFTQENGVTGGDGTKDNPYIIEGWNIEGTSFWKMMNKILFILEQSRLENRLIFFINIPICGIYLRDTDKHVIIRNNYIHNWNGCNRELIQISGVILINNSKITFEHNYFENNYIGINIENVNKLKKVINSSTHKTIQSYNCTNISVQFNDFIGNDLSAICICRTYNSSFSFNNISNHVWGIKCHVSKVLISENNIFSNSNGILCTQTDFSTIENNVIKDNGNGIYCAKSTPGDYIGSNPTIANNTISGNAAGIFICKNYPTIHNNTIAHNGYGIMNMDWSKLPVRIIDNEITYNRDGISYWGPCIIEHNKISSNDDGIYIRGNSSIKHNIVSSNKANGIFCGSSSGECPIFHYNNIFDNGNSGMRYMESVNNDVINATYNYWGSSDGPSGYGPGSGDEVDRNIIFEPWLIDFNPFAGPR